MKHGIQIQKDSYGYNIWWGSDYSNPYSAWISAYVESKPPFQATVSCELLNTEDKSVSKKSGFKKLDDSVQWCLNVISARLKNITSEVSKYKINLKEN